MALEVLIPKLGLTMETGLIEEWLVEAGTPVHVGDPILRLATDKVNVDVEAEGEGLFHPIVAEGSDLPPGALIGWLLAEGEEIPGATQTPVAEVAAAASANPVTAQAQAQAPAPSVNGDRFFASPNARRLARGRGLDIHTLRGTGPNGRVVSADVHEAPEPFRAEPLTAEPAEAAVPGVRSVSPLVRRDALAAGVDIGSVAASGPGGRVRRADVAAASLPALEPGAPREIIPLSGMRGVIAERMTSSLREMAQLTLGTDAVMDAVVALRVQLKQQWAAAGLPVPTFTDLVVRAAALALVEHPRLNATVHDDHIVVHSDINVGLAVALADGLMVPVVRNADRQPLSAIAAETRRLAGEARSGRPALSDLEGGTFTVSTLGGVGIDFFTPVITPGQVAILGVGRLRDSVRWDGDTPVRTQVLTLSLTFDHRAVDGAPAAEFLKSVVARLAAPLGLLA